MEPPVDGGRTGVIGIGGGTGSTGTGLEVSTRAILLARYSVNHSRPSGPAVRSEGSANGVGTGNSLLIVPVVVIRTI